MGLLSISCRGPTRVQPCIRISPCGVSPHNVLALCQHASDRARNIPSVHPQSTLQDEVHFVRVTELMAMLLGPTVDELIIAKDT